MSGTQNMSTGGKGLSFTAPQKEVTELVVNKVPSFTDSERAELKEIIREVLREFHGRTH